MRIMMNCCYHNKIIILILIIILNINISQCKHQIEVDFDENGNIIWKNQIYYHNNNNNNNNNNILKLANESEEPLSASDSKFWVYVAICTGLVLTAGIMSGLTIGLSSIDPLKLSILQHDKKARPIDRERALKLKPLLADHHLLLVTLLVMNASAMEALPIFLDKLVGPVVAIVLSVTFVLLFGEIIPQAVCTKDPLRIGAMFASLVKVCIIITYPLSYPIGKLLDYVLGHDSSHVLFKRSELEALYELHSIERGGHLLLDEVTIMKGALALKDKVVGQCLTRSNQIYMLPDDTILDEDNMGDIMAAGYSRVPIYHERPNNIKGMVLVKRLILVDPEEERCISDFAVRLPIVVSPATPMFDMLNIFQLGSSHLALVTKHVDLVKECLSEGKDIPLNCKIDGIITLEDVIEELIQEEVIDETDAQDRERMRLLVLRDKGVHRAMNKFKLLLHRRHVRKKKVTSRKGAPLSVDIRPKRLVRSVSREATAITLEVKEDDPLLPVGVITSSEQTIDTNMSYDYHRLNE